MNWKVEIDGRPVELHLGRDGESWTVNGQPASVLEVEPGIYSVLLSGRSFEVRVERDPDRTFMNVQAHRFETELIDPRRLGRKSRVFGREGRQSVAAPMPGKVVRVLVAQGDEVQPGQGLIVIEAMKMQNEMKAPKAGRVVSLTAREGANVTPGEVLAVIE